MRRPSPPLLPLLLAAALLIGCGQRQGVAATDVDSSSEPTHSRGTPAVSTEPRKHRSHSATPTTAPDVTGPLADFPLALGYAAENGDDGSPVEITPHPATRRFGVCDRTVWDPRDGTTDLIGVEYRGEAEYFRGRTLVLYPDTHAAGAAVAAARAAVTACPDEPGGKGQGTTHSPTDDSLGDQSLVWTDTFYTVHDGEQQHDTGLVVYVLVRVGRAVLLGYEYGEGNGSAGTRDHVIALTVRDGRALVQRMRNLPAATRH
jgi:hypothetical protein